MARLCIIKIEINFNVSHVTLYFLLIFCNFFETKILHIEKHSNMCDSEVRDFFLSHIVTNIETLLCM